MRTAEPRNTNRVSAISVQRAGLGTSDIGIPAQPLDGCRRQWSRQAADDRLPITPCRGRQVCWREPLTYRGRLLPNDWPGGKPGAIGFQDSCGPPPHQRQDLSAVSR